MSTSASFVIRPPTPRPPPTSCASPWAISSAVNPSPCTGIAAVAVAPESRGTGVATRMMQECVREIHRDKIALSLPLSRRRLPLPTGRLRAHGLPLPPTRILRVVVPRPGSRPGPSRPTISPPQSLLHRHGPQPRRLPRLRPVRLGRVQNCRAPPTPGSSSKARRARSTATSSSTRTASKPSTGVSSSRSPTCSDGPHPDAARPRPPAHGRVPVHRRGDQLGSHRPRRFENVLEYKSRRLRSKAHTEALRSGDIRSDFAITTTGDDHNGSQQFSVRMSMYLFRRPLYRNGSQRP